MGLFIWWEREKYGQLGEIQTPPTSSESQDVLYSKSLCLLQVLCDSVSGLVGTSKMQHCIQAAVVEGSTGYRHGAGLLVPSRVACRVPRHVTEERSTWKHPVKPVYQIGSSSCRARRKEFQGKEPFIIFYLSLQVNRKILTLSRP